MTTSFIQQFTFALVASMAVAASAMSVGCGDNQFVAEGEHYQYVVSEISLAASATEAAQQGEDLDGDGRRDNALGAVFGLLRREGFDIQPDVTAALRNGGILMGLDVQTPNLRDANFIGAQAYRGMSAVPLPCASSDPASCGQHLVGNAQIRVAPAMEVNYATGPMQQGEAITRADELTLKLAIGTDVLINVMLHDVVIRLTDLTATSGNATFAGVVSETDVRDIVIPQAAKQFNRIIDRDCAIVAPATKCSCVSDSGGADLVELFDKNLDCEVSDQEMRSDSIVKTLTYPDIESSVGPGMSFSVRAKLVGAQLLPNN